MKPIGWKNLYKHANYEDKMPKKCFKNFKRGEKNKVKIQIKQEINYDIIEDFEKEYQIRLKIEDNN